MALVEHYDWKSNLEINLMIMRGMGLWPKGDETYTPGFYMVYSGIMVTLVACHLLSEMINIYFVFDDLEAVVGIIYIILIEIMAGIKAYFVIVKMKVLKDAIVTLRSDHWFQPKNLDQKLIIQPSIDFWKLVYKVFLSACFGCNLFWMIPLLNMKSDDKRLPFLAWYPFDVKVTPLFEITYVYQLVCTGYLTMISVNVDALICVFNVYIGCQFDMLCDNLRNFVSLDNETALDIGKKFVTCVRHHKKILKFVEGCSQFFNWILFWHLIISGVSIGITMFQLTLMVPLSTEFFSLLSYGCSIILQIFMYCYFGNEVQVKSDLVAYAPFESQWTDLPENIKMNIIIFVGNVLRPVKISAFNIFILSLETFMKILKTAWSYFALLYQLSA
ncbi:hypothetical protein Zmor_007880 [Zophobas morio]|uniref:Odorant receptor n=1 Tax=Zophobas morio TaxID=2755281 RepID=A0AA38MQ11_9CUCU|nr:hypothetical protein Zmor_023222 [Zophobas morio]KAJ3663639.1 hypothetical protein Zmor_007880 [Zophobas morio]